MHSNFHSGFCCESPRSSHGLCRKCSEVSYSISSQGLGSFSRFLSASSSSSAFTTISSAKWKLVISRPPMLTLPSMSSHLILSRKMLKRVGESRHPC